MNFKKLSLERSTNNFSAQRFPEYQSPMVIFHEWEINKGNKKQLKNKINSE